MSDIQIIVNNIKDFSHAFSNKHILITGFNGFLGKYFVEVFDELNKHHKNIKLTLMDNFLVPNKKTQYNHKVIEGSITDKHKFIDKFDYIINAARRSQSVLV